MVNTICIIGYLPVAIATAVYTYQWIEPLVKLFQSDSTSSYDTPDDTQNFFLQYMLDIIVPVVFTFVSFIH